jgi:hypothetical protein
MWDLSSFNRGNQMIPKLIFEEIQNSIDIFLDEGNTIDAGYLQSAKTKIEDYEGLSENEQQVVEDEFRYWIRDNGLYSFGKCKRALVIAMVKLGFLEVYEPKIYATKPKTNVVEGVRYVIW